MVAPRLDELAALTEADFRERFRQGAVKRAKLAGLQRNVAAVVNNQETDP